MPMRGAYTHRPVLLDECIQGLAIRPDGTYVDGTLGRGGHSEEIVKRLTAGGRLICIDRDRQALEEGAARLAPWAGQITFLHGNFGDLGALLDQAGVPQAVYTNAAGEAVYNRYQLADGRTAASDDTLPVLVTDDLYKAGMDIDFSSLPFYEGKRFTPNGFL